MSGRWSVLAVALCGCQLAGASVPLCMRRRPKELTLDPQLARLEARLAIEQVVVILAHYRDDGHAS